MSMGSQRVRHNWATSFSLSLGQLTQSSRASISSMRVFIFSFLELEFK